MSKLILILAFFVAITGFLACTQNDEVLRNAVLDEYRRLRGEFEVTLIEDCDAAILELAEMSVDSIILELNIDPLKDSLYNPSLPVKPEFIPIDSAIFNDGR